MTGESITNWYTWLQNMVSKVMKKASTLISPNNYDVTVNTQFWTRLFDVNVKNALRHKFNGMAGSPNFMTKARRVESEFKMDKAKVNQLSSDSTPPQKSLDEILNQLSFLEKQVENKPNTEPISSSSNEVSGGQRKKCLKTVKCFKCHKMGHIARNCPLNSKRSDSRSSPTQEHYAVLIQGNVVQALLDTGSMVSSMAASLQASLGLQILELDWMLTVEGAGGHRLP